MLFTALHIIRRLQHLKLHLQLHLNSKFRFAAGIMLNGKITNLATYKFSLAGKLKYIMKVELVTL